MKNKIRPILKFLSSYKMLFILWLTIGVMTLSTGTVTRITYAYVWALLLIEYLAKAMDEK